VTRSFALCVLGGAIVACVFVPQPSGAGNTVCSVFSHHPCVYYPYHQVCSVFRRGACTPEALFPFSQQLQLTIKSNDTPAPNGDNKGAIPPANGDKSGDTPPANEEAGTEPKKLNTIRDVFTALRRCWVPPAEDQVSPGLQLSVRLSFKRNGEPIGEPRLTYVTPGISERDRHSFWEAVQATFHRCVPLAFSNELGGALAGRPFAIRFVDNRQPS
jgi:hypothetical protein